MSRVITFSRKFPKGHAKEGQRTLFPAKIIEGLLAMGTYDVTDEQLDTCWLDGDYTKHDVQPKYHTIRSGRRWQVGMKFSPRVWSGKPYASKQIIISPDIEIKKTWDVKITNGSVTIDKGVAWDYWTAYEKDEIETLAKNDGLTYADFISWFNIHPKTRKEGFTGQIISWSDTLNYSK